ncbi:RNA-guided endonuclease TnpB family protein [Sporosarcina pasteurii]|uniref:Transposase, IS605 OrfB family n=1 Tax=Sporosarcina pasteurii TaxID=1474 RepID=A0A380CJ28_SPOPA|nr:RNA-guided endonuclease TnpB family protein [Sporosarcina pasteurii]MDS9472071.1 transposase [Sporosarcina pasteurii]QBQ06797.1 transposase [Sporosarcina pasteurii]SUJ20869.1 transposase, IS605 OrfB family [Sporosarcina pasteurii]
MTTITAKIQIYVPDHDVEILESTTSAYRQACNWLSKKIFQTRVLNLANLNNLYYKILRETFGLKSQMAQSAMRTVVARYKSAKSNGHKWSQVRFRLPEYDLVWNRDYSLNQDVFSVNTLSCRLKFKFEKKAMKRYFNGTWKFGTAKLVQKFNKWFLHIPMTKKFAKLKLRNVNHIVGIDLGVNFLATSYDSHGKTTFFSGKQIKQKRGQYKALRKQLAKKQTASARSRIKAIGSRENRYVTDVNHQITKALVERYPRGTCFVLEDLKGVRKSTEKVCVKNRYVHVSLAFHQFREMLTYKATMNGQLVIIVNPAYTSQTCPKCEHKGKANRNKKTHTFCCKNCTYTSNDDRIGAMNLHDKGMKTLRGGTISA